MLRKLIVGGAIFTGALFVLPVLAAPSIDLSADVDTVRLATGCTSANGSDPTQEWDIALDLVVENTSEETVRFASTGYFVKFTNPDGSRQTTDRVTILDAGGFTAGAEVGPGGTATFEPTVRAATPCDATGADIFATLRLENRDRTYLDGATFLDNGTPVPMGPTGVIGLAAVAGAAWTLARRLGRRPKPLDLRSNAD